MTTKANPNIFRLFFIGVIMAMTLGKVSAADLEFHLQLVWGTDGPKPADNRLKEIGPILKEKFSGIFKWKNYYEVTNKNLKLPIGSGLETVKMSPKCELKIQNQGGSFIEVQFFGEGKLLKTVRQVVVPGELLVIAGDDKNDTAWFVVMTRKDGLLRSPMALAQWKRQARHRLLNEGLSNEQLADLDKNDFETNRIKNHLKSVHHQKGFSAEQSDQRIGEVLEDLERLKRVPGTNL